MAARADRFGGTGPGSEISIRNMQFLDNAIARSSEIRLSSDPLDPANAGSAFLDEINYLPKGGLHTPGEQDGSLMQESIERLQALLLRLGAVLGQRTEEGAFAELTYALNSVVIQLVAEYGTWRATIRYKDHPFFPASFWIAALGGSAVHPEPAVTEHDIDHLLSSLAQIVAEASILAPMVEAMGESYWRAMRDRLT